MKRHGTNPRTRAEARQRQAVAERAERQELRRLQARSMTEDELLSAIVEAALLLGWQVHHDRRSDLALTQGTRGFPDLVLAKDGRVLFWECKDATNPLTQDQWAWMRALAGPEGDIDWWLHRVIRPQDLDDALRELAR